jgi:hypothetical protein
MKKLIGAALLVVALVGCGGPLEGDDAAATGSTQQGLIGNLEGIPNGSDGPTLNAVVNNPIQNVVRVPAFQERMHVTDPLHANPRH